MSRPSALGGIDIIRLKDVITKLIGSLKDVLKMSFCDVVIKKLSNITAIINNNLISFIFRSI